MRHVRQDLHYAWRMTLRQPLTSALAVLTLALGVGATTALFSAVYATLLRPPPYPHADRLVMAAVFRPGMPEDAAIGPLAALWRARATQVDAVAAWSTRSWLLTGAGDPEPVSGVMASRELFAALDVHPARGRAFLPNEDRPGGAPVAIVSHALWRDRFASDPGIVGRTLSLSDRRYTIVGVMPAGFQFPEARDPDVYLPLALPAPDDATAPVWIVRLLARLKPDVTSTQARAELDAIVRQAGAAVAPRAARMLDGAQVRVDPLQRWLARDARGVLLLLLGAVGCVLLIAGANLANLQLARAAGRGREVAVRTALGAGRLRIVMQLLTESLFMALPGALLALAVAYAGIIVLRATPALGIPRAERLSLDTTLLCVVLVLACVTALVSGLAAAFTLSRGDSTAALARHSILAFESRTLARAKTLLLVGEIGAAVILLVFAGLLVRSLWALTSVDPGFAAADRVQTMYVRLRGIGDAEAVRQRDYFARVLVRVRAMPGVRRAGLATTLPLDGSSMAVPLVREDRSRAARVAGGAGGDETSPIPMDAVSDGYFESMGIPLLAGRDFWTSDTVGTLPVAIVNETLARQLFPDGNALGQRLRMPVTGDDDGGGSARGDDASVTLTIVGIVGDVRQQGLAQSPGPAFFRPFLQAPAASMAVAARADSEADAAALAPAIREAVRELDHEQPMSDARTMAERLAQQVAAPRTNARLVGLFGLLSMLLAAGGLYGVMTHILSSRIKEMGLRLALGARPADVRRLMMARGLRIGAMGVACGLAGAVPGARLLTRLLFAVRPLDPITLVAVPFIVLAVVVAASYGPARRAATVDPMTALRVD